MGEGIFVRWKVRNSFYNCYSLDDLEIKAPEYSSGETDQDDNLEVIYAEMTSDEKN